MTHTIGIIGSGQMGAGIAQVCALAGHPTLLYDANPEALARAVGDIGKRLARLAARERISTEEARAAEARLVPLGDMQGMAEAQLVIEAATENEEVKRKIYAALCPLLPQATILATNTSSLSITRLGAATDRPERFIGMHFMNPAPVMRLIEVVRGIATDDATWKTIDALATNLGKTTVLSQDFPAFIVNRVLLPMINEAIYVLHEGVSDIRSIDDAMRLGANHPMGPLSLADMVGLDTCLAIMQSLHDGLADTKYRPCPLLVKYVEAGWLGRKTGRGFYNYADGTQTPAPTR